MTRRLARFAPLLLILILLAGCTTYSGNHYRDGYYSDGGYYYPAEDGYGDYYAAPDYGYDYDYYDYGYSTYTPFWGLHRYGCGAWGGCSPYWSYYYGRPYSGWSLSYGQHWSYGSWGWYGQYWAPWYGHGYYGHGYYGHGYHGHGDYGHGQRPPHHGRPPGPDQEPPPAKPDVPRPHLPYRAPITQNPGLSNPTGNTSRRPDIRHAPIVSRRPAELTPTPGQRPPVSAGQPVGKPVTPRYGRQPVQEREPISSPPPRYVRQPMPDQRRPAQPRAPQPIRTEVKPSVAQGGSYGSYSQPSRPSPAPRQERPAPKEVARPSAPPPRAESSETRPASQKQDRDEER